MTRCPKCQGFLSKDLSEENSPHYCLNCGWRQTRMETEYEKREVKTGKRSRRPIVSLRVFFDRTDPRYKKCECLIQGIRCTEIREFFMQIATDKEKARAWACVTHLHFWERKASVTIMKLEVT